MQGNYMIPVIISGRRDEVATWVASRIRDMGEFQADKFEAIGVAKSGRLIGGVIYSDYRELAPQQHDIRMHWAGEPGWLTKATLAEFFAYPFEQLHCIRTTGVVSKANKRIRDVGRRLGFREEGLLRHGFGFNRHAIILGMTKDDCKWIRKKDSRGKSKAA